MNQETARACKAAKLMWALELGGRRIGVDAATVKGVNDLIELAGKMGPDHWEALAKTAGVNVPSAATVRMVQMLLRAKASFMFDQPAEKSLTYSERPGSLEVCR